MIAYGLGLSMSANLAYNLGSQSAIDGGGGIQDDVYYVTTDAGDRITTDAGDYIIL